MGEGCHRARIRAARVAGARRVGIWWTPSGLADRAALTPPIMRDGVFPRLGAQSAVPRTAMVLPPDAAATRGGPA
jgi:hypothetical protein